MWRGELLSDVEMPEIKTNVQIDELRRKLDEVLIALIS